MKLVRENLSFERTDNPLRNMGIGRRAQIEKWLEEMEVENYTINDDLTIDVNGRVDLRYRNLSSFSSFIKFRNVEGYFYCSSNQLTSLEGCPQSVGGGFYCSGNKKKFTIEEVRKLCNVKREIVV